MEDSFLPPTLYYNKSSFTNFFNKIATSKLYMKFNPLRRHYEYNPHEVQLMARIFGVAPLMTWKYGSLDYNTAKFNKLFYKDNVEEWNPMDDKSTPPGYDYGGNIFGDKDSNRVPYTPAFISFPILRGCEKILHKYTKCAEANGQDNCFKERIDVMEICPQFELEKFKEHRKFTLRAEAIDNMTYRRAMEVSDYNKGRTVSDIKYHNADKLRTDSYFSDKKYDPRVVSHPYRNDVYNFPEQEYTDIGGGTFGMREEALKKKYTKSIFTHMSAKDKERIGPASVNEK